MTAPSELPPLPEPTQGLGVHRWAYSADDMRTYALQAQALAPRYAPAAREADERSLTALALAHEALIEAAECLRTDYPGCEDDWLNPVGIIVDHCETAIEAIEATGVPQDSEPTSGG
jgi:hypothetical protein